MYLNQAIIQNILGFINDNSSLWSLLATIATVVYVILTYRLLKEMQRVRIETTRPYIVIDIYFKGAFLHFTVKNIGNAPANNINLSTIPSLKSNLSNLKYLPPDKSLTENLVSVLNNRETHVISVEINYFDNFQKQYIENIDINVYDKSSWLTSDMDSADRIQELTAKFDTHQKKLEEILRKIK